MVAEELLGAGACMKDAAPIVERNDGLRLHHPRTMASRSSGRAATSDSTRCRPARSLRSVNEDLGLDPKAELAEPIPSASGMRAYSPKNSGGATATAARTAAPNRLQVAALRKPNGSGEGTAPG